MQTRFDGGGGETFPRFISGLGRSRSKAGLPGPARPRRFFRAGAGVVTVPGRYSVSCLVFEHGRVGLVDLGSHADIPIVTEALADHGFCPEDVAWATATHLHFDHIMGLDAFCRRAGVEIRLGKAAAEVARGGVRQRWFGPFQLLRTFPATYLLQGAPGPAIDDLRHGTGYGFPGSDNRFLSRLGPDLEDGGSLPGMPGWTVLSTPGHTHEAICLYHRQARFLVAGDTVRNFLGGEWNQLVNDPAAYRATRDRLLRLEADLVVPGHGPVLQGPDILGRCKLLPWYAP